jgi:hypothetical protein
MLHDSRLLRISSKDRNQRSGSRYDISYNTNDNDLHQIKKVTLKSVVIPNTQYNINKYNNVLYMPNSLSTTTYFEIKQGQYKLSEFISAITTSINTGIAPNTISITQDPITQKLTLQLSVGLMDIIGDITKNKMAYVFGFDKDDLGVSSYECINLPNLSGLNHIYISSQMLSNHTQMITHDKNKQNVFADITMKVCFGHTQYTDEDSNSLDYVVFHSHKNISKIDIKLLDEHNNELDLNGFDWTLIFRVYQ